MSLLIRFNDQAVIDFKNNWKRFLTLGIILFIVGCFAIYAATFTTIVSVVFLGFIILLCGVVILFDTFSFWRGKWSGFFLHLLLSILYIFVGVDLIIKPVQGSISLTFILGIFYIIAGLFRIIFSSATQPPSWGWGWLNGVITLLLGIMIMISWPVSGLFIIGLFVGIDLVVSGLSYIIAALRSREAIS